MPDRVGWPGWVAVGRGDWARAVLASASRHAINERAFCRLLGEKSDCPTATMLTNGLQGDEKRVETVVEREKEKGKKTERDRDRKRRTRRE